MAAKHRFQVTLEPATISQEELKTIVRKVVNNWTSETENKMKIEKITFHLVTPSKDLLGGLKET